MPEPIGRLDGGQVEINREGMTLRGPDALTVRGEGEAPLVVRLDHPLQGGEVKRLSCPSVPAHVAGSGTAAGRLRNPSLNGRKRRGCSEHFHRTNPLQAPENCGFLGMSGRIDLCRLMSSWSYLCRIITAWVHPYRLAMP